MVLLCRNCSSAWRSSVSGLEQIAYTVLPGNDTQGDYLPFWKIKARVDGVELKSRADFIRLTNATQLIKRQWEEREFYFWSPAFKVSPEPFLRLSQGVTMVQPEAAEMQGYTKGTLSSGYPCRAGSSGKPQGGAGRKRHTKKNLPAEAPGNFYSNCILQAGLCSLPVIRKRIHQSRNVPEH